MADDEPLAVEVVIDEGVTGSYLFPVAHREGVQARVDRIVAAKADDALVDHPLRFVFQEVHEVIATLRLSQPGLVRHGGQQYGVRRVILQDLVRVQRLQRRIPAVEESLGLLLRHGRAALACLCLGQSWSSEYDACQDEAAHTRSVANVHPDHHTAEMLEQRRAALVAADSLAHSKQFFRIQSAGGSTSLGGL